MKIRFEIRKYGNIEYKSLNEMSVEELKDLSEDDIQRYSEIDNFWEGDICYYIEGVYESGYVDKTKGIIVLKDGQFYFKDSHSEKYRLLIDHKNKIMKKDFDNESQNTWY